MNLATEIEKDKKMPVIDFEDEEHFNKTIDSETLVLVDYYADWCPPCRAFAPILEALSEEFEGEVIFGKVNVDDNMEIAEEQAIQCMPTFIFYKKGQQLDRVEGANKAAVCQLIARHKN